MEGYEETGQKFGAATTISKPKSGMHGTDEDDEYDSF